MAGLTTDQATVREAVRNSYAEAARRATEGGGGCCAPGGSECGCGCGSTADAGAAATVEGVSAQAASSEATSAPPFGAGLYTTDERSEVPELAASASLGCGNPLAIAELREGEVVLDLGSGAGMDVLLSARRVGRTGRAYGLDMTDEMLALARENQREAGVDNVEWLKGTIEDVPLPDASVDVVISNCVINLSPDKTRVFGEAARILRPGGRLAVMDVVADPGMDERTGRDMGQWAGCVAGALTRDEFLDALESAGFRDVEVTEVHRVQEHAGSAIVRARV